MGYALHDLVSLARRTMLIEIFHQYVYIDKQMDDETRKRHRIALTLIAIESVVIVALVLFIIVVF